MILFYSEKKRSASFVFSFLTSINVFDVDHNFYSCHNQRIRSDIILDYELNIVDIIGIVFKHFYFCKSDIREY